MRPAAPRSLLYILFALSGATGLVYELVWTRELIFIFGGTTYAITTVLVAFMGGLGLGSYLIGRVSHRFARPGAAYGVLEICIGIYALLVPLLLSFAQPLYRALYPYAAVRPELLTVARFLIGCAVLLPPTTLMGATLPLLVRFVTGGGGSLGRSVALLYGLNTGGAVLGVLATGFFLIPGIGLSGTTRLAALANIAIGFAALSLFRTALPSSPQTSARRDRPPTERPPAQPLPAATRRSILLVFAISGFSAMVYQVAWTRALVMSFGSSTYSFTCILAAFILGLALGSLAVAPRVDRLRHPVLAIGFVLIAIGLSAVSVLPIYGRLPALVYGLVTSYGADAYERLIALQFALVIGITLAPTLLMGMVFPLVTRSIARGRDDEGAATGRAYGVNTLGTILGSFCAGFVFLSRFGVHNSIVWASLLDVLAGALLVFGARGRVLSVRRPVALAASGVLGVLLIGAAIGARGAWDTLRLNSAPFLRSHEPGWMDDFGIVYYGEGVDLSVLVARGNTSRDDLFLTVNGKADASTYPADMTTQILLGHVPALIAPRLRNACVIGLGCGMTVSALARYSEIERIDCAEISREVVRGAMEFAPFTYDVLTAEPRLNLFHADGRNHLLLTDQTYDLIVSEPSNPWMAGVSNLFTREFFGLCQERLTPDGVLCIWMQGYGISLEDLRMIVRTLSEVFAFVTIWEMNDAEFALVAGNRAFRTPIETVRRRFHEPAVRADLYRIGLGRVERVLGHFITAGGALRDWSRTAELHTDDAAQLEFSAPRHLYADEADRISDSLYGIQRSLLDETIAGGPDAAGTRSLTGAFERMQAARTARADTIRRFRGHANGVQLAEELFQIYHADPESIETFRLIMDVVSRLRGGVPAPYQKRSEALLRQFVYLRPPIWAPRTGATLSELARTITGLAAEVAARDGTEAALPYLREAHELAPADGEIVRRLAGALVRIDDSEAALRLLSEAVGSGSIAARELAEDPTFESIRDDPRFLALTHPRP